MTNCESCGRPPENGQATHWLGCDEAVKQWVDTVTETGKAAPLVGDLKPAGLCEHDGCSESKWSDGPRTKFCTTHKDPKNREK